MTLNSNFTYRDCFSSHHLLRLKLLDLLLLQFNHVLLAPVLGKHTLKRALELLDDLLVTVCSFVFALHLGQLNAHFLLHLLHGLERAELSRMTGGMAVVLVVQARGRGASCHGTDCIRLGHLTPLMQLLGFLRHLRL